MIEQLKQHFKQREEMYIEAIRKLQGRLSEVRETLQTLAELNKIDNNMKEAKTNGKEKKDEEEVREEKPRVEGQTLYTGIRRGPQPSSYTDG